MLIRLPKNATDDWIIVTDRPRLTPAMADVRRAVRETWLRAGVGAGDRVVLAVSGGADSMALALASAFEGARVGVLVGAIVVEHGLQPETKSLAPAVVAKLESIGIFPAEIATVEVSDSASVGMEAAARSVRYEALEKGAKRQGARFVMLGHTLNDQAETVLLGLTRGSGIKSMAGMREIDGLWLRPLLEINRATTEACCLDSGVDFWVDPQNSQEKFTRVRLRNSVLPHLERELGPGVAQALARTAQLFQQDLDYLEQQTSTAYAANVKVGATIVSVSVAGIEVLPPAIASRVLHRVLSLFTPNVSKNQVDQVHDLVTNWHGQKELSVPGARVVRQDGELIFKSSKMLKTGAC